MENIRFNFIWSCWTYPVVGFYYCSDSFD